MYMQFPTAKHWQCVGAQKQPTVSPPSTEALHSLIESPVSGTRAEAQSTCARPWFCQHHKQTKQNGEQERLLGNNLLCCKLVPGLQTQQTHTALFLGVTV